MFQNEVSDILQKENTENESETSQTQIVYEETNENITEKDTTLNGSSGNVDIYVPTPLFKVSDAVFTTAVTLGNFLFSAANYAGQAVKEASSKIIETVEENNILGQFNKVQKIFVNQKNNTYQGYLPPWEGCIDEDDIKEKCLSLSADKRNFLKSPPVGTNFNFDYNTSCLVALSIMKEDPRLEKVRYDLVPKVIPEENFWKNYFYRVNLILQAHGSEQKQNVTYSSSNLNELSEESWMKEIENELNDCDETNSV